MKCKYYFILGSDKIDPSKAECMDVSEMITNLDDIKMSYTRADLGGIVRKISSEIQLCGDARDSIVDYYSANMLASVGAFGVYRIKNDWSYEPLFECPLDFTSFSYDSNIAKIGCIDNSVSALIKANKNVKYEIPVSEIKDDAVLYFDGIRLKNEAKLFITGESVEGEQYTTITTDCTKYWRYMPPVYFSDDDVIYNKKVVLSDQKEGLGSLVSSQAGAEGALANENVDSYFLTALEDTELTIDISKFSYEWEPITSTGQTWRKTVELNVLHEGRTSLQPIMTGYSATKISLLKGDKLQLALRRTEYFSFKKSTFKFYNHITIGWMDCGEPIDIDVVKPIVLLNRIVHEMGATEATCTIEDNDLIEYTRIVASESIRNFKAAKLYTSFNDFCNYMEAVYGYIYQAEDDSVKFIHRSSVFRNNRVKALTVISEPNYKVAADRIYSDIEIGYTKQDYDLGNNGNDEFNSTNYYSTGVNLKSRKLKLISPYRADGYGFQEQAGKRTDETSQDKSDSNIFIVHISNPQTPEKYTLDRSLSVGGTYTNTVFNAAFNPLTMIQNNIGYLSSFCQSMKFTASDGNTEAVINGEPLNKNITMSSPLFRAGELTIKTNDMILPREWNGYISFVWDDRTFNCYLKGMDISIVQNEVMEYEVLDYELIER